jgi:FtsH-binding integral membrane protein
VTKTTSVRTTPARIETTRNHRFARRVVRLAWTSLVALGVIWWLGTTTPESHWFVGVGLLGGWVLMPLILWLSLRWPRARYGLIIPSSLVSLALVTICLTSLPDEPLPRTGWLLITSGVLLGGLLGGWFWFRWLPVPAPLYDPFSLGRSALVSIHISLILGGLALIVLGRLL